jgi:lipid A 3-O-deacylase
MMRRRAALAALALALASGSAWAVDGIVLEAGSGEGVRMARLGVRFDWTQRWLQGRDWHLGGSWDAALGQWHHRNARPGQNDDITEVSLTPVFRLQANALRGPYVEAGLGAHLLSRSQIGDKRLSTSFHFGSHAGVGYRFGERGQFDVGYRFQHLSNAGIKKPNPGINFNQIRFVYRFR